MKLIDVYNNYKNDFKEYVILIVSGIFYEVFNNDIGIMYSFFNYKIKYIGNKYIIGFPVNNLSNILDNLKKNNINYIVIDKDSDSNYYSNYKIDCNKLFFIYHNL